MGSKNSHPASRERAVKSAIKTFSIIFTYSSGQTGNSTGKQNILRDLSVSCGGGASFPSLAAKHEVKQQVCSASNTGLMWTCNSPHRKWHKQGGPREESHQWRWWATLWMIPDMCGCNRGQRVWWWWRWQGGVGIFGCLQKGGWSVRKTALSGWFSYDSWCPRGAQQ